ncbi:GerAB/ArcD/ProY family transporter [Viridibacillus arvi]|uniref:GerAB/ArcD/ProY family transporter n=1 Tax=Viridibacillus arvi TaxID=263475 RepID=UPI00187B8D32|nr:GerAB/ArcD/ProY family transporter [Viridibacillus sp. JNUCC-6]QOV11293.1 GerAB/ArcD/ProY family transporter [Viridibacillus sp. JNUCC-6]
MKLQLSRVQFFLILFIVETGVVFISFQTELINKGGRDSWIIFTVLTLVHFLQLLFYEKFHENFQLNTLFAFLYKFWWIILCICYIAYIDYTLATWGFPNTPTYLVISLIVLVSLYANLSQPETAVNIGVILIPLIVIFIIFILMSTFDLVWTNIFPIGTSTREQWIAGFQRGQTAYLGIELYFIFRVFVINNQIIKWKPLFIYQLIVGIFFIASVIGSQFYFSLEELKLIPEPIMYILKSEEVTFVKRLDIFFIYIWLTWSIVSITLIVLSIRIVHFSKKRKYPRFQIILLHLAFIILPLLLLKVNYINNIRDYLHYGYIPFSIVFPIIIVFMNRRRKQACSNESSSS